MDWLYVLKWTIVVRNFKGVRTLEPVEPYPNVRNSAYELKIIVLLPCLEIKAQIIRIYHIPRYLNYKPPSHELS